MTAATAATAAVISRLLSLSRNGRSFHRRKTVNFVPTYVCLKYLDSLDCSKTVGSNSFLSMKALQKPYDTFVKTQLCELGLGNASM